MGSSRQPSAYQQPIPSCPIRRFLLVALTFCAHLFSTQVGFIWPIALQFYLTLTALAFASWNAGASRAAGVHGTFIKKA
jgi:hypothetical protein